ILIFGRFTSPCSFNFFLICCVVLLGMASPIPSAACCASFIELIPLTFPFFSTNAPPLLPGLMAASVCKTSVTQSACLSPVVSTSTERFKPLIIPFVTEPANSLPNGLPIATTVSPTSNSSESENSATASICSSSISNTAKLVNESDTSSLDSQSSSFEGSIAISCASSITWLVVTIYALSFSCLYILPEPVAHSCTSVQGFWLLMFFTATT